MVAVAVASRPLRPCMPPARRRSDRPPTVPPRSILASNGYNHALMSLSHLWTVVDELDSNSVLHTITDTLSADIRLLLRSS